MIGGTDRLSRSVVGSMAAAGGAVIGGSGSMVRSVLARSVGFSSNRPIAQA